MNSAKHTQETMIEEQLLARGVHDKNIIEAMSNVPREDFIPKENRNLAYEDGPVNIGFAQTVSQPYIVGFMAQALALKESDKVLEIGTGSGYNAAILSKLCKEVYSIEVIRSLKNRAQKAFDPKDYPNIHLKIDNGKRGWPEEAPFDAIIITAASNEVPQNLFTQLSENGRLIAPIGDINSGQDLMLYYYEVNEIKSSKLMDVRFVPLVNEKA